MELRQRKKIRLQGYDYGHAGWYFITICVKDRAELFWDMSAKCGVGADIIRPVSPVFSQYGVIANQVIQDISLHYASVYVDKYVVMPNHIHMILVLAENHGRMISAPTKAIPTMVGQMKRAVSKKVGFSLWQKSYHDHIIRSDADYRRIWEYIDTNPARWQEDCYYVDPAVAHT